MKSVSINYKDDGLAIIEQKKINQTFENTKKKKIKLFNKIRFKTTIDIGTTTCNFIDKTLNLTDDKYKPYRKENSDGKCFNNKSNYPITIKITSKK